MHNRISTFYMAAAMALILTYPTIAQMTGTASSTTSTTVSGNGTIDATVGNSNNSTHNAANGQVRTSRNDNSASNHISSWSSENIYWRNKYRERPYYTNTRDYSLYEPAYRYGVDMYNRNADRRFDSLSQSELNRGWSQARGNSTLNWDEARSATRDAYNRLYEMNRDANTSPTNTGSR